MSRKKLFQIIIRKTIDFLHPLWRRRDNSRFSHCLFDMACALTRSIFKCDAFTVETHDHYLNDHKDSEKTVIKKNREGCYANIVWSEKEKQEIWNKPMNDLCLYKHHDVYVCGDSDVVIDYKEKTAIHDLSYNLTGYYRFGDSFALDVRDGMMLVKRLEHKNVKIVKSGIMIAALYSYNYFHAVLDNLIRLLAVDECDIPGDAVFIVDSVIYKYESLKKIFDVLTEKSNRQVVLLEKRELLHVDTLYYITHVNEFVIKIDNWKLGRYDDYTFDWFYMQQLRERLLALKKTDISFGSRVFISRKNIPRRSFNEAELMDSIKEYGFVSVCPEEFCLEDQIALFNNADVIVSSSGAAMTNLLFCKPGSKALIIEGMKHQSSMYSLIPAKIGMYNLHYSIQIPVNGKVDENFSLDVDDFMNAFRVFMSL